MKARDVKVNLIRLGFVVSKVEEGNDVEDGMCVLTDKIHVQVATYDNTFNVVKELPGPTFQFYPPRTEYADLFVDIMNARQVG